MTNIIVTTSTREQQDVMSYLKEKLRSEYFTDTSISIIQSGIAKVDVIHSVKGVKNLAARYQVVIVPVSMSLDSLLGFSHTTNININRLLDRLEKMKAEAIAFVNLHKKPSHMVTKQKDALKRAAYRLFE